jgi:hypothetical protein
MREFQSNLQMQAVSCDFTAPVGILIVQTCALFRRDSSTSAATAFYSDPLALHIPASSLPQILSIRFPGGGGLDKTTAMLCCKIASPVVVQSFEAVCDRLHLQWYRLVNAVQRTPAVMVEFSSLRFELQPSIDAEISQLPTMLHTSSSSSDSPESSSSQTPQKPILPIPIIETGVHFPLKFSFLCDGTMQVLQNFRIQYSYNTAQLGHFSAQVYNSVCRDWDSVVEPFAANVVAETSAGV